MPGSCAAPELRRFRGRPVFGPPGDCGCAGISVKLLTMTRLPPKLLISAYLQGIFPMGVDGRIEWFSPDPRAILPLEAFHAPRTLRQLVRQRRFDVEINKSFRAVMEACADREDGTWISREIIRAYTELHRLGLAHSVEAWKDGRLAGGLYGVSIGGAFFGESMFHAARDASKVALVALVERMRDRGFALLDVQFMTTHLRRFGAVEIPREDYLTRLANAVELPVTFV